MYYISRASYDYSIIKVLYCCITLGIYNLNLSSVYITTQLYHTSIPVVRGDDGIAKSSHTNVSLRFKLCHSHAVRRIWCLSTVMYQCTITFLRVSTHLSNDGSCAANLTHSRRMRPSEIEYRTSISFLT